MHGKMNVFDDRLFNQSGCGHYAGLKPYIAYFKRFGSEDQA
jgi:hypothetical protein